MDIRQNDYILGVWFISSEDKDWLCTVVKRDGKWVGEYRFRYYADDKVFDSDDKKSFYTFEAEGDLPEELIKERIDTIAQKMTELDIWAGSTLQYVDVRGDGAVWVEKMRNAPFVHIQETPTTDYGIEQWSKKK